MASEKTMNARLQQKHDIEANWLKAVNFIPKDGELIIYDVDDNYSYPRIKVGDGKTFVNELPFSQGVPPKAIDVSNGEIEFINSVRAIDSSDGNIEMIF